MYDEVIEMVLQTRFGSLPQELNNRNKNFYQGSSSCGHAYLFDNRTSLYLFQEAFGEVVQFFGCNTKTTQPNSVFPVLYRFVEGFRVSLYVYLFMYMQRIRSSFTWHNEAQYKTICLRPVFVLIDSCLYTLRKLMEKILQRQPWKMQ